MNASQLNANELALGQLRNVIDPEAGINIVDMGLIYGIAVRDGRLHVKMTLTTPGCPMGDHLLGETQAALYAIPQGIGAEVELVWDPAWTPSKMKPETLTKLTPAALVELDVRPLLAEGQEPFNAIMSALARTPSAGALRLVAPLKPTPLLQMLGSKGWSHWIETGDGDYWSIWFFRDGAPVQAPSHAPTHTEEQLAHLQRIHPEFRTRLKIGEKGWTLDVRKLPPPEPMELTLLVLAKLPAGTELLQLNERIPQFLLPLLAEQGYEYTTAEQPEVGVLVRIFKPKP